MAIEHHHVIVAGTTPAEIKHLLPFARVLAQARQNEILALGLVAIPEGASLSAGARPAQKLRQKLEALAHEMDVRTVVRVAHHPWGETESAVKTEAGDLLLVNSASGLPADVLRTMPCDVVVVNSACLKKIRRILLPIRGGPYAALALEIALAFAEIHSAEITVLHAAPSSQTRNAPYEELVRHLHEIPQITRWKNVRGSATDAIQQAVTTEHCQLLVMGAIAQPRPSDPPIGPTATKIMKRMSVPVLVVKSCREFPALASQPEIATPPVDYTVSVVVDKWFAENTFHAHEFEDIQRLVELKKRQGVTISLGLPTLNEAKTIGKIIRMMRARFMEQYPLLDEIVVIDSNSTDSTVKIANDLGVPVFCHPDILPAHGAYVGKGEALWKSLHILKGDIIAWIDTDIVNIHPRFVYGILGPLLKEPHLMYVKGFYQRPLRLGKKLEARGGGRVTELVARPLFNLFYPELSGMIQPLAGEYAGRREALEQVPFFTGYGVETGLLIDLVACCGLRAIGQVDLEQRVHRNQSLLALSKMAFAIIQVVLQRVGENRDTSLLNEMNKSMKLIHYAASEFHLSVAEIRDVARPPMREIPEYRKWRERIPG